MNTDKIIYWGSTAIISILMLFGAYSYYTSPLAVTGIARLGFPDYFRIELATAKLLGAIALILPWTPSKIKEYAYAGFSIMFISAFIAHLSSGVTIEEIVSPIIAFIILAVSYRYYTKLEKSRQIK
ncbi:MAG: DoxX family protein [Paludibacter sp.]|nr:DoxX family protein [Paludibacter sp.]